jgi:hypothetical protein
MDSAAARVGTSAVGPSLVKDAVLCVRVEEVSGSIDLRDGAAFEYFPLESSAWKDVFPAWSCENIFARLLEWSTIEFLFFGRVSVEKDLFA